MANPYELRFDTLQLARGYLEDQYNAEYNRLCALVDKTTYAPRELANLKFPTIEQILDCANTFKKFVDGESAT